MRGHDSRSQRGPGGLRKLLTFVAILFAGFGLTVVLRGVWAWIELRLGLESIGPDGPALWTYPFVWFVLALLFWPRRR